MSKFPPYIINHPEDGQIRIGEEDLHVVRKADIQIKAGSDATLRPVSYTHLTLPTNREV